MRLSKSCTWTDQPFAEAGASGQWPREQFQKREIYYELRNLCGSATAN